MEIPHKKNTSWTLVLVSVVAIFCILAGISAYSKNSGLRKSFARFDAEIPEFILEEAPTTSRYPQKARHFSINLFQLDVVQQALKEHKVDDANLVCNGPENNIDVFINEDLAFGDLLGAVGYTTFNLDCRDKNAMPLVAFLLVVDHYGNVVNINHLPIRAESVSMFDTSHILYSTISGNGAFIWNWRTDEIRQLPFLPDQHALQYVHSTNSFYGLYLDEGAKARFSPSIAGEYDGETGDVKWTFEPGYSHANYVSVSGKYVYVSLRSAAALMKVDKMTSEPIWTMGGRYGDIPIVDIDGNYYEAGAREISWSHQHKFQHVDDKFYSLFDNHVGLDHGFLNDGNSRLVLIYYDENENLAREIFAHDTGDKARIYGASELLPTGNILGNSYPYVVHPSVADRQYHVNLWEVTPEGDLAWRVGVKGLNPWNPSDLTSPYPHSIDPEEEPPVGWMVYNAERFYDKPVIAQPCSVGSSVRVRPFNTVKTSEDMPGIAYVYAEEEGLLLAKVEFAFHKSWVPRNLDIPLPEGYENTDLSIVVVNNWKDSNVFKIGQFGSLETCSSLQDRRLIR
jgi:hypothetical protein